MHVHGRAFLFTTLFLLILCVAGPGCTTTDAANLSAAELKAKYLENAQEIRDYKSEYTISGGQKRISVDWKEPGNYRIEFLESEHPEPGTLFIENQTMTVMYDPVQDSYTLRPESRYGKEYDHQAMVRRIVEDGRFTITGKSATGGGTLYKIEVVTEPWSMDYTEYASSRVQAWIDPEAGVAREILTYYPSDTLIHTISYEQLDVNTGIPDSYFIFNPPQQSVPQCGSGSGIWRSENYNPRNISPALKPGCLDCTETLLTKPIGGFNGNYLLVHMVEYEGKEIVPDPDPHTTVNYTFYSRNMSKGTVSYTLSRVAGLYDTGPIPPMDGIAMSIEPAIFNAGPGQEYSSEMTVHVRPGTELHENYWIHIHADVEGDPDAVTDDWIRLALDNGDPMSGSGLWHFYQGGGGYCQDVLVIKTGETGHTRFAVRTAELGTGTASLSLIPSLCHMDHGPLRPDERPAWPEGITSSISPSNFTVRSFASYTPDMIFTVSPDVKPGDYCFSMISRTPGGGAEYAPMTLRVMQ